MSIYLIASIAYCLVCALVSQLIYPKNGIGLILGLLFGVFGLIVSAILSVKSASHANIGPSYYQVIRNNTKYADEQKTFDQLLQEENKKLNK